MTDLIKRADAIDAMCSKCLDRDVCTSIIGTCDSAKAVAELPSAELTLQTPQTYGKSINPSNAEVVEDYIKRTDAIEAVCDGCVWYKTASCEEGKEEWECSEVNKIRHLPSADAVHIHNDGTLEVKVPNAQKVGRVLVMDTDSHIGGGLFYPDDADRPHGEWLDGWEVIRELSETRCMYNCFDENDRPMYEAMTSAIDIVRQMMCGARMKGGDE